MRIREVHVVIIFWKHTDHTDHPFFTTDHGPGHTDHTVDDPCKCYPIREFFSKHTLNDDVSHEFKMLLIAVNPQE